MGRAGGVANAVNGSAQAAYDSLTSRQQDAARQVFTQLTAITPDGQFARRRCSRTDLRSGGAQIGDIDAVIDVFSAQRLLVLGQDTVEISDDTLLQAWKQLRDWLADDQLDRVLYSQIVTDAANWDSNRRDSSYLYQPGRLAAIDAATARWQNAPTRYSPLPATSKEFLDAAHHAAYRIQPSLDLAWRLLNTENTPLPTPLAADAGFVNSVASSPDGHTLASGDSDGTIQLWDVAQPAQPSLLGQPLASAPGAGQAGGPDSVSSVAFSPDGHTLASGGSDGTGMVQLWNVADPMRPRTLGQIPASTAAVDTVAFSPDGHTLASGGSDGTIQLWDVTDPAEPQPNTPDRTVTCGSAAAAAAAPSRRWTAWSSSG